jgi:hypothetical protein
MNEYEYEYRAYDLTEYEYRAYELKNMNIGHILYSFIIGSSAAWEVDGAVWGPPQALQTSNTRCKD